MSHSKFTTRGDEPLEARIVAWVLGEASAFEAEELQRLCDEQPELAVFKRRIEAVHGLAGEAHRPRSNADSAWKLSPERRAAIEALATASRQDAAQEEEQNTVVTLEELAREQRVQRSGRQAMLAIAACLVLTLVVATLTWPLLMRQGGFALSKSDEAAAGSEEPIIVTYSYDAEEESVLDSKTIVLGKKARKMVPLSEVASGLPAELIEGTPRPMNVPGLVDPSASPAMRSMAKKKPKVSRRAEPTPAPRVPQRLEKAERESHSNNTAPAEPAVRMSSPDGAATWEEGAVVGGAVSLGSKEKVRATTMPLAPAEEPLDGSLTYDAFDPSEGGQGGGGGGEPELEFRYAAKGDRDESFFRGAVFEDGENNKGLARIRQIEDQLNTLEKRLEDSTVADSNKQEVYKQRQMLMQEGIALHSGLKQQSDANGRADKDALMAGNRSGDFSIVGNSIDSILNDPGVADELIQLEAVQKRLLDGKLVEASELDLSGLSQEKVEGKKAKMKPEERKRPVVTEDEIAAAEEPYSTFSLNVNDASFRIAQAALAKGELPDPSAIKVEQFYNAVDYGDPAPPAGLPVSSRIEQAAHPVIPGRNLVRIAIKTASEGRNQGQPLRLTLLIDQSGSMAREDRRQSMIDALEGLRGLLTEHDQVHVIGFARTPRLLAEALPGNQGARLSQLINIEANEGGTNLEEAIKLGQQLAERHQLEGAQNRMVLFTDGAANLGDADPDSLANKVKELRQKGIAFDIAGIAADGLNDDLLAELARHGNGRYYVVGKGENDRFAEQLAGAFRPAAENVKVQVRFNPERVGRYKLIGFEKDRLNKEDFRNDAVDAAEMAAEEAGVAIYQVETLPEGEGEIGEVSVRFRNVATGRMVERSWTVAHDAATPALDRAPASMQLAVLSMLAGEKLRNGPLSDAIDFKDMTEVQAKVAQHFRGDARVAEMMQMLDQLK